MLQLVEDKPTLTGKSSEENLLGSGMGACPIWCMASVYRLWVLERQLEDDTI